MSDALTTGSERLAGTMPVMAEAQRFAVEAIAADPGVKALVEHATWCDMHGTDDETAKRAFAALKLWRDGDD